MSRSLEYHAWCTLKQRCKNPNAPNYADYGGRGISVCERWEKFENFYADMGPRPSPEHSLDRIDNDGPYEKANCRWALRYIQQRNRRWNHLIEYAGENLTLSEWSERTGFKWVTIYGRLRRGWSIETALTLAPSTTNSVMRPSRAKKGE